MGGKSSKTKGGGVKEFTMTDMKPLEKEPMENPDTKVKKTTDNPETKTEGFKIKKTQETGFSKEKSYVIQTSGQPSNGLEDRTRTGSEPNGSDKTS